MKRIFLFPGKIISTVMHEGALHNARKNKRLSNKMLRNYQSFGGCYVVAWALAFWLAVLFALALNGPRLQNWASTLWQGAHAPVERDSGAPDVAKREAVD